jgi:RNA polymerase sigma-70 factor, ECF subfamily
MSERAVDQEAIRSLYELYADDIYRYARLTLGPSWDEYDVVQEVFLRAFRSWDEFRQDANGKTWLMRIARNYMFDLLRKKRTERNFLSTYEIPTARDDDALVETVVEVEHALSQLKDAYRQVIVLRHIENLSVQGTGDILGWSEAKVRTTTHRAMAKLRQLLDPHLEEVNTHHEI